MGYIERDGKNNLDNISFIYIFSIFFIPK